MASADFTHNLMFRGVTKQARCPPTPVRVPQTRLEWPIHWLSHGSPGTVGAVSYATSAHFITKSLAHTSGASDRVPGRARSGTGRARGGGRGGGGDGVAGSGCAWACAVPVCLCPRAVVGWPDTCAFPTLTFHGSAMASACPPSSCWSRRRIKRGSTRACERVKKARTRRRGTQYERGLSKGSSPPSRMWSHLQPSTDKTTFMKDVASFF